MKELSLFSGAGGGLLATKHLLGWTTIGYVENNEYCQKVLRQRIKDGFLDAAPIFGDIRKFISEGYAEAYQDMVDVITAGPPCQPYSCAGLQLGQRDPRDMLGYTVDAIRIVGPRHILLENVPTLLAFKAFGLLLGALANLGYCLPWDRIPAAICGAPHIRKRLWLSTNSNFPGNTGKRQAKKKNERPISLRTFTPEAWGPMSQWENWLHQPGLLRVPYGYANIVDRIKAIGNGQVPAVVEVAWKVLSDRHQTRTS